MTGELYLDRNRRGPRAHRGLSDHHMFSEHSMLNLELIIISAFGLLIQRIYFLLTAQGRVVHGQHRELHQVADLGWERT